MSHPPQPVEAPSDNVIDGTLTFLPSFGRPLDQNGRTLSLSARKRGVTLSLPCRNHLDRLSSSPLPTPSLCLFGLYPLPLPNGPRRVSSRRKEITHTYSLRPLVPSHKSRPTTHIPQTLTRDDNRKRRFFQFDYRSSYEGRIITLVS